MKSGWQTKKLGEVCKVIVGQSPEGKFYNKEGKGHPFYQGKKEFGEKYIALPTTWTTQTKKIAIKNDILISVRAPVGPINYSTGDICIGRGLGAIRCSCAIESDFLFYFLLSIQDRIAGRDGAVFASINKNDIESFLLPLPPLPEQHRIVAILNEAFKCIATAKANAKKNLKNARELFESYLHSIFSQRGEGWVEKRLGDIAKTQYGLSEPMNEEGKGFKIFRMGEIQNGRLIDTGLMKFANIDRVEFEKYKLQPGDILFNRTNSFELVGKTGIFDMPGSYCFASYLVRLLLNKKVVLPEFLNYFMNSKQFQNTVKQKASKSINQSNINATILSNEPVRFPESLKEQKTIVTCLDSLRAETKHLESLYQKKLLALDELKQSLLNQAFTGQLSESIP